MGFLKKNICLIATFILAIFLRINYDLFINGYNFDELAIVSLAKQETFKEVVKSIATLDYHAPLYYFIIRPICLLKNEWVYIRLLNLVFSLLNIFVFYKIGTILKNKKLGLFLALFLAINHLEIATVSFVKFYCLCILLFSFNIYYLIKIIKKDEGYKKFALFNILFILSSTFGFIFVFIEYFTLFIFKKSKVLLNSFLFSLVSFFLYLPIFINQYFITKETILSPHAGYSEVSLLSFYVFLNDYFSPLINYCCNLVTIESCSLLSDTIKSIQNNSLDVISLFSFLLLSLIPVIIALFLMITAIKDNKIIKKINVISLIYLIFFSSLVLFEKTGFISTYLYPCGIIALVSAGYGVLCLKNKKIATILFIYLIFAQLIIPNCYPISKRGVEKAKIYYVFENYFKKQDKNTSYIVTQGGRFLEKYYSKEKIFSFDLEEMSGNYKKRYLNYLFWEKIKQATKKNLKDLIEDDILNNKKSLEFEKYFKENVVEKTKKNEKIILCFYADESPFLLNSDEINLIFKQEYNPHLSKVNLKALLSDEIIFDTSYLAETIATYSYTQLIELLDNNFKRTTIEQYQKTQNGYYVKTFEGNLKDDTLFLAKNVAQGWIFVTYQKIN